MGRAGLERARGARRARRASVCARCTCLAPDGGATATLPTFTRYIDDTILTTGGTSAGKIWGMAALFTYLLTPGAAVTASSKIAAM
jgi:hypothetical protein